MPRKRAKATTLPAHIDPARVPPYCYYDPRGRGRWVWRRYDSTTGLGAEVRIGDAQTTQAELWAAAEHAARDPSTNRDCFAYLSSQYQASSQFAALAADTRSDYQKYARRICDRPMQSGRNLGDLPLAWWDRTKVQRYLDKRAEEGAPVVANREASYMRTVFDWSLNRGLFKGRNPAVGPKRNRETARKRYVEDHEYQLVLNLARTSAPWYVPFVMEIMYLTRCRQVEALSINVFDDVRAEGLHLARRKGSRANVTLWSARLRAAVDGALRHPDRSAASRFLFTSPDGARLRSDTFRTAWQRLMVQAVARGLRERFTSEDLKPKGVTDTDGNVADKMAGTGHKSTTMVTRVYDRKPGKAPAVR